MTEHRASSEDRHTVVWAAATLVGWAVVFLTLTWAAGPLRLAPQDLYNAWTLAFGVSGAVLAYRAGLSIVGGAIVAIGLGPIGLWYLWTSRL